VIVNYFGTEKVKVNWLVSLGMPDSKESGIFILGVQQDFPFRRFAGHVQSMQDANSNK
jgi:hypothetical protein